MTINQTTDDAPRRSGDEIRDESFAASGPVSAKIQLVSGDTTVRTAATDQIQVRVTARGHRAPQLLEDTRVSFDAGTAVLTVCSPLTSDRGMGFPKLRFGTNSDVDVEVTLPENSSVDVRSASGDAALGGVLNVVEYASASGDIVVGEVQELHVQSASGDVLAQSVAVATNVKSASGDVRVSSSRGLLKVANVSGDVHAGLDGAGTTNIRSVSGDVSLDVRQGLTITVDAKTMSGDLSSDIDLSGTNDDGSDSAGSVSVSVSTMSGDVRVRRAKK